MRTVLGIDAAWTERQPSGVALAIGDGNGWELVAAEASYQHFLSVANGQAPSGDPTGQSIKPAELVKAAQLLTGQAPDLVAVDMPMSRMPITGRRTADSAISKTFGAQWCSTHTPSVSRPGNITSDFSADFAELGYQLCTEAIVTPGLIEVYPHPALVRFTDEPRRLPYKVAKIRSYWPKLLPFDRELLIRAEWSSILTVLEQYLRGSEQCLVFESKNSTKAKAMKAHEDKLDAVICCVVAIQALNGKARPFGDADAAIWVPDRDEAILSKTLLPSSPCSSRAEARMELTADRIQNGDFGHLFSRGRPQSKPTSE